MGRSNKCKLLIFVDNQLQSQAARTLETQPNAQNLKIFFYNFINFLQTSKTNVTEFMETWTEQMGYPVVNITRPRSGSGTGNADQKHFLLDPNANVTEPSKFK